MKAYFADKPEEAKKYDCSENILTAEKMPFGLIDQGSHDDFLADMGIEKLKAAIAKGGHKIKHRMCETAKFTQNTSITSLDISL